MVVNSLSREREIVVPKAVEGSYETIYAVDLPTVGRMAAAAMLP